ncbi:hypothetical protein SAMN05421743_10236 [Thalassobacillus cyri]|uniref:Uncharacterized protein n=1 Tax=Thalassobacillus cyri TaxID=571932 RepID=A0A1H3X492_9BACI|nr:hypothetical protein [Thalassobacillus cyri]SDZ94080.1 hypothetical protein SAMN05421743_10236 [Thalassobacillus cyri]
MRHSPLEVMLWSIAFPGFGQLLNRQLVKGIFLIVLEVIINLYSNFNTAIIYSYLGDINKAIEVTDFQWLMFYPCLYMFTIWDAYKDAYVAEPPKLSFLPFVFSAYFVTVGLIYSTKLKLFGVLIGPVWLPMLFVIPGLVAGFLLRAILLRVMAPNNS